MKPRSRSRTVTPRRSYSRSPDRRTGRRKSNSRHRYYSSGGTVARRPPSPPPEDSRSASRSRPPSPRHSRRDSSRRHYSRSRSISKSRSPSRSHGQYNKNKRHEREKPLPCRCIGVFGLSIYTTQFKIREIFEKYGPIERIQVVIDAQTGRSRGFCFIYYDKLADAIVARDNCCSMEIDGRRIRVAYSITERPHTPTPGVYMGRSTTTLRESHRSQRPYSPKPFNKIRYTRRRYERSRSRSFSRSRSRSYSPRRNRY